MESNSVISKGSKKSKSAKSVKSKSSADSVLEGEGSLCETRFVLEIERLKPKKKLEEFKLKRELDLVEPR